MEKRTMNEAAFNLALGLQTDEPKVWALITDMAGYERAANTTRPYVYKAALKHIIVRADRMGLVLLNGDEKVRLTPWGREVANAR
jgi:hypothetical protein